MRLTILLHMVEANQVLNVLSTFASHLVLGQIIQVGVELLAVCRPLGIVNLCFYGGRLHGVPRIKRFRRRLYAFWQAGGAELSLHKGLI